MFRSTPPASGDAPGDDEGAPHAHKARSHHTERHAACFDALDQPPPEDFNRPNPEGLEPTPMAPHDGILSSKEEDASHRPDAPLPHQQGAVEWSLSTLAQLPGPSTPTSPLPIDLKRPTTTSGSQNFSPSHVQWQHTRNDDRVTQETTKQALIDNKSDYELSRNTKLDAMTHYHGSKGSHSQGSLTTDKPKTSMEHIDIDRSFSDEFYRTDLEVLPSYGSFTGPKYASSEQNEQPGLDLVDPQAAPNHDAVLPHEGNSAQFASLHNDSLLKLAFQISTREETSQCSEDIDSDCSSFCEGSTESIQVNCSDSTTKKPTEILTRVDYAPGQKRKSHSFQRGTNKLRKTKSFQDSLQDLLEFKRKHGHCDVTVYTTNPEDIGSIHLLRWVKRQRYLYKIKHEGQDSSLSDEKIRQLEDIGFVWDARAVAWESKFNELKEYRDQHGDCNIPRSYKNNQPLSTWVKRQRRLYFENSLQLNRIERLEKIGFVWDMRKYKSANVEEAAEREQQPFIAKNDLQK